MELSAKATELTPVPKWSRRRKRRRLALILATPVVLIAAWKVAPQVEDRIRLHLAERAIVAGRFEEAEARLDLLISEHPARTGPRLLRARVAREQGHITDADEKLQRAIELGLPIEEARAEHDLLRR